MNIQSALYSGMQGFSRASAGVTDATLKINQQTQVNRAVETDQALTQADAPDQARSLRAQQPVSLTNSLVQLGQEERNAQANVKTIQAADEMLGTVIDIRV